MYKNLMKRELKVIAKKEQVYEKIFIESHEKRVERPRLPGRLGWGCEQNLMKRELKDLFTTPIDGTRIWESHEKRVESLKGAAHIN